MNMGKERRRWRAHVLRAGFVVHTWSRRSCVDVRKAAGACVALIVALAGGPARGAPEAPPEAVRVRVALSPCPGHATTGTPVRIRWEATSLAKPERSVVYWPRRALDAVDFLSLRAPTNAVVRTIWQLKDEVWIERQHKLIASSKDPVEVARAKTLLQLTASEEHGRWGPRTTGGVPSRMLRPGQTASGIWDLAELYAFTQPGDYELVLRSRKPEAVDFVGTTNVRFRITE